MPRVVQEGLLERIAGLQAEEALLAAQISILPHVKPSAANRVIKRWEQVVTVANRPWRRMVQSVDELRAWAKKRGVDL